MTIKKDKILIQALELFSEKGFDNTPTSRIAREAGVSEGLIFRHFENKTGLLKAIINMAKERMEPVLYDILSESDPSKVVEKVLGIPMAFYNTDENLCRLAYSLKFQNPELYTASGFSESMQPLIAKVQQAFTQLDYKEPQLETAKLFVLLDGLNVTVLKKGPKVTEQISDYIRKGYRKH